MRVFFTLYYHHHLIAVVFLILYFLSRVKWNLKTVLFFIFLTKLSRDTWKKCTPFEIYMTKWLTPNFKIQLTLYFRKIDSCSFQNCILINSLCYFQAKQSLQSMILIVSISSILPPQILLHLFSTSI